MTDWYKYHIKHINKILLFIIFLFQLLVCIWFGHTKETFFVDEVYSYGLANSEECTFLDQQDDEWFRADVFKNYVTSSPNKMFQFRQAYINQVNDVHPPFYYFLIHIASSLSGDNFTKWTGIGLNLFLLIFADLLLYYVAREFLKSPPKALFALILWSFSAAGISSIIFIRMYFLLTVEILAYVAIHIKFVKTNYNLSVTDFELLLMAIIIGGLTHYYFYIFALTYSLITLTLYIIKKRYKLSLCYICTVIAGLITNYIYFPAIIKHVLHSDRGIEVFSYMSNSARHNIYTEYFNYINNSISGGYLWIIICILLIIIIFTNIKNSNFRINFRLSLKFSETTSCYVITVISGAILWYIAVKGSGFISHRYIYFVYPILAILIINLIFYTLSQVKTSKIFGYLVSFYLIFFMCFTSINIYGIDYQYQEFPIIRYIINSVKGYDYLIYRNGFWVDIYTAVEELFKFDEFIFFNENNLDNMKYILAKRQSDNPLVVAFPSYIPNEEKEKMLKIISDNSKYKHTRKLYNWDIFHRNVFVIE